MPPAPPAASGSPSPFRRLAHWLTHRSRPVVLAFLLVSLARSGDHVELTVSDDGQGFDLEAVRRGAGGLGLVSMEERAHVVGGDVQIITGFRKGTTIRVRCPADHE